SDTQKVGVIRSFLAYTKKQGWTETNLAAHIRIKKVSIEFQPSSNQDLPKTISLSQEGYSQLEAKLAVLKTGRLQAIDEMRKAAADKDFRENAPLEAAREQRQHLERMIRETENTLKLAVIIEEKQEKAFGVDIGIRIILRDLDSGEELHYMIVNPKEAEPVKGKISSSSPIGQAIIGRGAGEIVEVLAPTGRLRYQIKDIIRP
ncbi:GreA/GreB family elongation factor, partial [Chloroflexota bacterium]